MRRGGKKTNGIQKTEFRIPELQDGVGRERLRPNRAAGVIRALPVVLAR